MTKMETIYSLLRLPFSFRGQRLSNLNFNSQFLFQSDICFVQEIEHWNVLGPDRTSHRHKIELG